MKDFGINTSLIERAIFNIFKGHDPAFEIKELDRKEATRHEDNRIAERPHLHPTKGFAGARKRSRRSNRT